MKTRSTFTLLLIAFSLAIQPTAWTADSQTEEAKKFEQKMRDEKKNDEQEAKHYADNTMVARFDSVWRSPRNDDIDVFQSELKPSKPFKVIALMIYDCEQKEETKAVAALIVKAKNLGAEGIQLSGSIPAKDRIIVHANAIVYEGTK